MSVNFQTILGCSLPALPHSVTIGLFFFLFSDEGVFKAGKKRTETRGAVEVQEDEETQTEVPVDQVIYKFCKNDYYW